MMDWAACECSFVQGSDDGSLLKRWLLMAVHARSRGAESWWKSFTTGKSAEMLGGVPHDRYGMTSLSVRQFVLGTYKQLGLREKDITKVQTGGPGSYCVSSSGLRCGHVLICFLDLGCYGGVCDRR
jgi:glutamate dehydrogenase